MNIRSNTIAWIAFVLVAIGMARAVDVVSHRPMLGYANQFDMHRTGACLGLYPDIDGATRYAPTPAAPIAIYRWESPQPSCYWSSEVMLGAIVGAIARAVGDRERLPLQWIGFAKIAILASTVFYFAWNLRSHPLAASIHALVVLVVLCDPIFTLWLNTLYTEFFVGWGLYAAVGALCAIALRPVALRAPWVVAALGLAALAFSKEQFALLPVAFTLTALPFLVTRSWIGAAALVGIAAALGTASLTLAPKPEDIHKINRGDTYLGVAIPAAAIPGRMLEHLGLPSRCLGVAGSGWFLRRGSEIESACKEVYDLPSTAFLGLIATEPGSMARAIARVLPATQQVDVPYVGILEGGNRVHLSQLPARLQSPLATLAHELPGSGYQVIVLVAILSPVLLFAIGGSSHSTQRGAAALYVLLLAGTVAYSLLTTVFGDGLNEPGRHFWAGAVAIAALGVSALVAMLANARTIFIRPLPVAAAIAAIAAAAWMCLHWERGQPLAIGLLDEPSCTLSGSTLAVRGWALAPFGVERVAITIGDRRLAAHYATSATAALAEIFSGYPDAARGSFALEIDASSLAENRSSLGGTPLRVEVTANGRLMVVDHCVLRVE